MKDCVLSILSKNPGLVQGLENKAQRDGGAQVLIRLAGLVHDKAVGELQDGAQDLLLLRTSQ